MVTARAFAVVAVLAASALLEACGTPATKLIIPDEMRRSAGPARTEAPVASGAPATAASASAVSARSQYTVRVAVDGRLYELQMPEDGNPYELRIPMSQVAPATAPGTGSGGAAHVETAAAHVGTPETHAPGAAAAGGVVATASTSADAAARDQAYLAYLAQVRELYAQQRYELALMEVEDLLASHANDETLWAMKGSLHQKLGHATEARTAWSRALELNPSDTQVQEALQGLPEGDATR